MMRVSKGAKARAAKTVVHHELPACVARADRRSIARASSIVGVDGRNLSPLTDAQLVAASERMYLR